MAVHSTPGSRADGQSLINASRWRSGDYVSSYANRRLSPVEVILLVRYREALSGRVLEVGCGAGRVLGYLVAVGAEVHGVDISPAMVAYCRRQYPAAHVTVGDLGALDRSVEGPFDAVIAADNVLDVFDDAQRRAVLRQIRELLGAAGLLIFSSHNIASIEGAGSIAGGSGRRAGIWPLIGEAANRPMADVARAAVRLPRRMRNRRRLAPLERREADYAIVNDAAHDHGLLHYYIGRDAQERQLSELGFDLLECLDVDGGRLPSGEPGQSAWLHYVCRPASA